MLTSAGMCTLVVLDRVHPRYPVIVAANRDEHLDRPARPPELLVRDPRVAGGRDVRAGGTWLAVNERGFFAALTNQRPDGPPVAAPRSRGEIVVRVAAAGDRDAAEASLRRLDPSDYNPFNLVYGDAGGLRVAYGRPGRPLRVEPVPPGVHVLPNDVLDAPAVPKVARLRDRVAAVADRPWSALAAALAEILADHTLPPLEAVPPHPAGLPPAIARQLEAVCIHAPGYGTRSASLVALEPDRVAAYLHAEGPPCRTPFTDHTALLA